jgi:hypothetical protein
MSAVPRYSIRDHLDQERGILRGADATVEYLRYLADVEGGAIGRMGFTLADFEKYIAGLKKR